MYVWNVLHYRIHKVFPHFVQILSRFLNYLWIWTLDLGCRTTESFVTYCNIQYTVCVCDLKIVWMMRNIAFTLPQQKKIYSIMYFLYPMQNRGSQPFGFYHEDNSGTNINNPYYGVWKLYTYQLVPILSQDVIWSLVGFKSNVYVCTKCAEPSITLGCWSLAACSSSLPRSNLHF